MISTANCFALSGLQFRVYYLPGAVPRADMSCPFGAIELSRFKSYAACCESFDLATLR